MVQAANADEQLVIDFFRVLSSGDLVELSHYLHEDMSWTTMITEIPGAGSHEGRDHVLNDFLGPVRGIFKDGDPKVIVDKLVSSGGNVMAETHAQGERADGKPYNNMYAWAFEISDGKISRVREYMDSLYIARFFDMLPEPAN